MLDLSNNATRVGFIWGVADLIRDTFSRSDYKDVILPFTVLRRIDCVLQPTKAHVLERHAQLQQLQIKNEAPQLRSISKHAFYNISPYDFSKLLQDHAHIADNLRHYINGFSDNMREVLENFGFDNTINKLQQSGLLFKVIERFNNVDLHPDKVTNHDMGYIFEELIRKYNEALNENPGEHFTPREIIQLMATLLLSSDSEALIKPYIVRTIYDPCCGSGGMLIISKEFILNINAQAQIVLYGQEVNRETFAICRSDLYMKSEDDRDAEQIMQGNTLAHDLHAGKNFDYMLANPPYGKDWKSVQEAVEDEYARGYAGRFGAGLPRISDGQLLFLQHMIAHMKTPEQGGSRIAIVMNGSPLFTGDAGSGESEIRRWILENDWLEAIVALPEQIFYNTGITTYIWLLSNRKPLARQGKVQLIDASSYWIPMQKSNGEKRRQIPVEQMSDIAALYLGGDDGPHSRIFASTDFGYRKITIERPLRLNFQIMPERLSRLHEQKAFRDLGSDKKRPRRPISEAESEPLVLNAQQQAILAMLNTLPTILYTDRATFVNALAAMAKQANVSLTPPLHKAILAALSERDENAEIYRDAHGNPEPDPELRDSENVPLHEDIEAYFEREVRPHMPDAWINTKIRDEKDGQVGKVGYEINFNRYFYTYTPPRSLTEIEADLKALEQAIVTLLHEVTE